MAVKALNFLDQGVVSMHTSERRSFAHVWSWDWIELRKVMIDVDMRDVTTILINVSFGSFLLLLLLF